MNLLIINKFQAKKITKNYIQSKNKLILFIKNCQFAKKSKL